MCAHKTRVELQNFTPLSCVWFQTFNRVRWRVDTHRGCVFTTSRLVKNDAARALVIVLYCEMFLFIAVMIIFGRIAGLEIMGWTKYYRPEKFVLLFFGFAILV